MAIKRSSVIAFLLLVSLSGYCYSQEQSPWEQYKSHFISGDGRIIDYYQDQASHSEGQGYGMLLAVMHDDRALFDKVWTWTKNNLRVRSDNLLAWKWGKRPNGQWQVLDYNNATDGDILVAFALIEAQKKWRDDAYKSEALKIIADIRKELAFEWRGNTLLLPGYYGFETGKGSVANPSYYIFPAYRAFAGVDEKSFWDKVYKGSKTVISEAVFTELRLPADWLILDDSGYSVDSQRSENFGYEAIRIPLYASLEEKPEVPEGVRRVLGLYEKTGYIPLWINLINGGFSLKPAPAGFYAVYARAAGIAGEKTASEKLFTEARAKLQEEKDDYYSHSLYLLASGKTN